MGGNPEQFASRGDKRQQQSRVAVGGVRVEGLVDQLGADELLYFGLEVDCRIGARECGKQSTIGRLSGADVPLGLAHASISTGTRIRSG